MMRKKLVNLSFAAFIMIAVVSVYSFAFPFEAGHPLQGLWFGLIITVTPFGVIAAWFGKQGREAAKLRGIAITGHLVLILFLFLYMTLGYVFFGV
jgi:hypothetical protein